MYDIRIFNHIIKQNILRIVLWIAKFKISLYFKSWTSWEVETSLKVCQFVYKHKSIIIGSLLCILSIINNKIIFIMVIFIQMVY